MSAQDPEALRRLSAEELIAALDSEEAEQAKWWVPDYEKRDALKAEVLRRLKAYEESSADGT